jgi:hypothetical protein
LVPRPSLHSRETPGTSLIRPGTKDRIRADDIGRPIRVKTAQIGKVLCNGGGSLNLARDTPARAYAVTSTWCTKGDLAPFRARLERDFVRSHDSRSRCRGYTMVRGRSSLPDVQVARRSISQRSPGLVSRSSGNRRQAPGLGGSGGGTRDGLVAMSGGIFAGSRSSASRTSSIARSSCESRPDPQSWGGRSTSMSGSTP